MAKYNIPLSHYSTIPLLYYSTDNHYDTRQTHMRNIEKHQA